MPEAVNAETLAVTSTTVPKQLTAAKYAGKTSEDECVITVEGGPIRFFEHAAAVTDVSTTNGHEAFDGDEITLNDDEISHFACVKATSTNATLQVSYRR